MGTKKQISIARGRGILHPKIAYLAAAEVELPYNAALAMLQMESADPAQGVLGGANIYGHDKGGALSTAGRSVTVCGQTYPPNSNIKVNAANCAAFLIMIGAGAKSNGVGPCQITYAGELPDGRSGGYFRQMTDQGLVPWNVYDNMQFGFSLLEMLYARERDWSRAFGRYNGGTTPNMTYGNKARGFMRKWQDLGIK